MATKTTKPRRTGKRAETEIYVSDDVQFIAEQQARVRPVASSPIEGEGDGLTAGGIVTHTSTATVIMYKPSLDGYMPRKVPVSSIAVNLANGWKRVCPDCNGHHGAEANACPNRPKVAIRVCPVCNAKIPDNRRYAEPDGEDDDPNIIRDDAYAQSTPASRTKAELDAHLWARHPAEARALGVGTPYQAASTLPTALPPEPPAPQPVGTSGIVG